MNLKNGQITVGEIFAYSAAKAIVFQEFPVLNDRMIRTAWNMPLNQVVGLARSFGIPQNKIHQALRRLKELPERA